MLKLGSGKKINDYLINDSLNLTIHPNNSHIIINYIIKVVKWTGTIFTHPPENPHLIMEWQTGNQFALNA